MTHRDLTVVNAVIHRPAGRYSPEPGGVVVHEGRITFVGSTDEALAKAPAGCRVLDAAGRYLVPGLIESHGHMGMYARNALAADCRPSVTPRTEDMVTALREAASGVGTGDWVRGWGYDEHRMDGPGPTREDLDRAAPEHPVYVQRTCVHMALVNSAALERICITDETPDPPGGKIVRDAAGHATGLLQESAMNLAELPPDTLDSVSSGMRATLRDLATYGVTSVHDMSTGALEMNAYQRLLAAGELSARVRSWYFALPFGDVQDSFDAVMDTGLRSGFGNDMLRFQGLKFVLDGSVGGRTAAVAEPFEGTDSRGILYYDDADVHGRFVRALEAGQRVAVHGIGERAVTQALDLIDGAAREIAETSDDVEAAFDELVRTRRHRVEHCALPTEADLDRIVDRRIVACSSTAFLHELGDSYHRNLGEERVGRTYPMRTFIDRGITAPSNSDFPVTTPNPWLGIFACVARESTSGASLGEGERISVAQALDAYTTVAARASFDEDRLGRIEPGFLGDLVLLDRNPFEIPPEELPEVRPVLTVSDGRVVFEAQ